MPEGARLRIQANTGVKMDGYDWFEFKYNGQTGYQWGGIMCSEGNFTAGMYQECKSNRDSGWMAFAVGANGQLGHGASPYRDTAMGTAMNYCGDVSCEIHDVTQHSCHVAVQGNSQITFGAGSTEWSAEENALNRCRKISNNCNVTYSYCKNVQ